MTPMMALTPPQEKRKTMGAAPGRKRMKPRLLASSRLNTSASASEATIAPLIGQTLRV